MTMRDDLRQAVAKAVLGYDYAEIPADEVERRRRWRTGEDMRFDEDSPLRPHIDAAVDAVLAELRQPTPEMLAAVLPAADGSEPSIEDKRLAAAACEMLGVVNADGVKVGCDVLRDWRAMLDEAGKAAPE